MLEAISFPRVSRRRHRRLKVSYYALLLVVFGSSSPVRGQPSEIFSDDFETGGTLRWSATVGLAAPPCASGPLITGTLAGDLGPAPAGLAFACLEVHNDQAFERTGEVAFSAVPLPRDLDLRDAAELVLAGPGGRRLAAQFDVLSRWGGVVDDASLPIRWLQVSLRPRVAASSVATYELRRVPGLAAAADPFAAEITSAGALLNVDTGLATFTLDPAHPALLTAISADLDDDGAGRVPVYRHAAGAGPRLVFQGSPLPASVDPGGFEIVERGPVKVVVKLEGHFTAPGGASLCNVFSAAPYERFGYTAIFTFYRGQRDFGLEFYLRNECSDAAGGSWTDDAVTVDAASWEWPFTALSSPVVYFAGGGAVAPATVSATVEQRKGAGNPWQRRARVVADGAAVENAEAFAAPLVALAGADFRVGATMPWMRFREPQALAADATGSALSLRFVSEPLVVGEGKAIWNAARIFIDPAALVGPPIAHLETRRRETLAALERGLLVRAPRSHVNASRLFPSLGSDAASPIKTRYLATLEALHGDTVDPGGQWHRAKTFGSQLWPDVQFDQYGVDNAGSPANNSGAMNYWNPSGAELMEHLRSGEPRWAWDFALPQSLLQMHTAYLNLGDHQHGNRNGVAVTSGGTGEGQWHRSAFGSDDYSYNQGLHLAYALRPSPALRDRFAQAGLMVTARYGLPQEREDERSPFVDQVDVTRQVIQHFEMLANCAEFVPGATGQTCHDRLVEILAELAADNLRAGLTCQGDVPTPGSCGTPQQFMQNALMYPFFHRMWLQYGDDPMGRIERALVEGPLSYYVWGMPKLADGVSIDVGGGWAAILDCSLTADDTQVASCTAVQNGDGNLLFQNKPHTLALLLIAHEIDPTIGLCGVAKSALDDPTVTLGWDDNLGNDPGWWKGAAQMMQVMAFGVGIYDDCADPAP